MATGEPVAARAIGQESSPVLLGRASRIWRTVLVLVLAVGFLGGTTVGDDHWWPFSPWRMYSTSTDPNTSVASTRIEVRTAADPGRWTPAPLTPENVGLNRAEIEDRLDQIRRDPAMLATLASSHQALRPREPAWVGIRVVIRRYHLADGALTGEFSDEDVAQWSAP